MDRCQECFYKTFVGRGESVDDGWCYMFKDFMPDCMQFKEEERPNMNHTPGQWKQDTFNVVIENDDWTIIASCYGNTKEERLANACLIASAPVNKTALIEVADAANDLWLLLVHNPDEVPYGEDYDRRLTHLYRELGAVLRKHSEAIAKAKSG